MIGHLPSRCVWACLGLLVVCSPGCKQAGTVPNGSPHGPSSWFSELSFSQHKQETKEALPAPLSPQQKTDVQMAMARAFEKRGQVDQAIKVYLDIVHKDAHRADAFHRLAVLHDEKGDCQTSEKFYRAALEQQPHNAEILCDRGYSYYLQRRWPEAEASLRQALAAQPDLARAHVNLGLLLARTGRPDESLMEFARAGCPEPDGRANLAFALMMEERWIEAQRQYELALAVDPQSTAARQGLDSLRSLDPRSQLQPAALARYDRVPLRSQAVPPLPFPRPEEGGAEISPRPAGDAPYRSLQR